MKTLLFLVTVLFISTPVLADLKRETIEYKDGETVLEGYFVYDDAQPAQRPGVVVVHDWMGFGEYAKKRADMLAELGYVALAVDIYGKGVRPQNTDEASAQAGKFKKDRSLLRARIQAGFDELKKHPMVDPERTAAIGYCFGGTTVLELARSGANVDGVVSFHGGLAKSDLEDKSITSKVLVLHGADDPYVPAEEVAAFQKEMNDAKADWQMVSYSGAVHSFTHKEAGNDNSKGAAYNANADRRSWEHMRVFFNEIF